MRVIIANHGIYPLQIGGMEKHTYHLAAELAKIQGIHVQVLVPDLGQRYDFPFSVVYLPWGRSSVWLYANYQFSQKVRVYINAHPPDVILSQGFNAWACLKDKSYPIIFHPHGLEMFGHHLSLKEKLLLWPFRKIVEYHARYAQKTISLGGQLTHILREKVKVPATKLVNIPNAVDIEDFNMRTSVTRKPKSFLFVGRLAFNKGIDFFPNILQSIADPDFSLTVVGDGPLRAKILELAEKDPRIKYLPKATIEDIKKCYQEHECLLFTSRFEGMPTVILEAMASGMMILATKIGAVETMFDANVGYLVEPNPPDIVRGIEKVLELPLENKKMMGMAARDLAKSRFSWSQVVGKYTRLFESMVS